MRDLRVDDKKGEDCHQVIGASDWLEESVRRVRKQKTEYTK
jgi:hypothetical protein